MHKERIRYLDISKGISLLLVMVSHSCGMPFGIGNYFTAFYIQIFFILSGITYKRGKTVSENIYKRFRGIIIPYFIYNLIVLCVSIILGYEKSKKALLDAVIGILYSRYCFYPIDYEGENIFFLQIGNSPMWFLTAMFLSSCIFYCMVECIKDKKKYLCLCAILLLVLTMIMNNLPILLPWSIDTAPLGVLFMLIGYYGKKVYLGMNDRKIFIILGIIYLFCCWINPGINISIREYGEHGIVSVIMVCIIGAIGSLLCIKVSRLVESELVVSAFLNFIGKNTIMILALHIIIFTFFDRMLALIGISEESNGLFFYGIGLIRLIATVGVCYCISCVKKSWTEKVLMR